MVKSSFRRKMGVWGWSIWCHPDVPNNPHRGWPPRCNKLSVPGRHLCWTSSICHSRYALHCLLPALCPRRLTFVFGLWLSSANEKFQQEIKGKKGSEDGEDKHFLLCALFLLLSLWGYVHLVMSLNTRSLLLTWWSVLDDYLLQDLHNSPSPCAFELRGAASLLLLTLGYCTILCNFPMPHPSFCKWTIIELSWVCHLIYFGTITDILVITRSCYSYPADDLCWLWRNSHIK